LNIDFRGQVILAFVTFLVTNAIAGIIGNRADEWFVKKLPLLSQKISISVGWLMLIAISATVLIVFITIGYEAALRDSSNLNKIGDTLARNFFSPKKMLSESPKFYQKPLSKMALSMPVASLFTTPTCLETISEPGISCQILMNIPRQLPSI
jgi:hypothetical protein